MSKLSYVHRTDIRVPRGHQGFWDIMLMLNGDGPWSLGDVHSHTNDHKASIRDFLRRLHKAGIVRTDGTRNGRANASGQLVTEKLYRLNRRSTYAPRLDRNGKELPEPAQEVIWRSIKMARVFTADELIAAVQLPEREIYPATVRRYLGHLTAAGVVVLRDGKGGQPGVYRLVKRLGKHAPKILRSHTVFDPNNNEVLATTKTEEAA